MSGKLVNRSSAATLVGLILAVPAAVLAVAPPAIADGEPCCQVSIDDMPAQFPAGGDAEPFTVRVVNQSREALRYLDVSFVLQAAGLVGDLVHLQRLRLAGGPHGVGTFTKQGVHSGVVTANDQIDLGTQALPPGGKMNIGYQLVFSLKMPSIRLELSVQVQPERSRAGISSAGPYPSTIVAAGQPASRPDPTPTPPPTAPASGTPVASGPAGVPAAPTGPPSLAEGTPSSGGSLAWLAYTIGALLVLGGIGLIGTLAWRRGPQGVGTGGDEPRPYGHAGWTRAAPTVYGQAARQTAPTAQFPLQRDGHRDPDRTWVDPAADR